MRKVKAKRVPAPHRTEKWWKYRQQFPALECYFPPLSFFSSFISFFPGVIVEISIRHQRDVAVKNVPDKATLGDARWMSSFLCMFHPTLPTGTRQRWDQLLLPVCVPIPIRRGVPFDRPYPSAYYYCRTVLYKLILFMRERERPRTAIKRRSRGIHLIKTVYEQKRGRWKKWEWLESRRKHTHYDITSVGWKTTGRAADALAISRALFHAIFHRIK